FEGRGARDGEKRPFKPRGDRPSFSRDDRPPRRSDRDESRPAGRFGDRKFGDKTSGDRKFGDKTFGEKRPSTPRGERPA
uniref:hypothetical protein n=1 Tax=Morganella morganii TaxID=582 RepID=UPI003F6700B7